MKELSKCVLAYIAEDQSPTELGDLLTQLVEPLALFSPPGVAGKTVLIKTDYTLDDSGNFMVPEFAVRALAEYFIGLGARVRIGDSPLCSCLTDCGASIRDRLAGEMWDLDVEWVSFEASSSIPYITQRRVLFISEAVPSADVIVNLANFRNDTLCRPHGAMANLIGLLPGYQKADYLLRNPGQDEATGLVADLLAAVNPTFSVLCVPVKPSGLVLGVSRDTVALDTWFSCMLFDDPDADPSPLIRHAAEAGLGIGWPEAIETQLVNDLPRGATPHPVKADSRLTAWPTLATSLMSPFVWSRPRIQLGRCRSSCTECAGKCPTGALEYVATEDTLRLREDRCIACWHCREVCPDKAISVERSPLLDRILS